MKTMIIIMCADKKKTNQTKRATHFSQNHTNTPRDNRSRDSMQFEEEVEEKTTTTNKLVLFDINFYLLLFLRVSLCCPYARQPKKKTIYEYQCVQRGRTIKLSSNKHVAHIHKLVHRETDHDKCIPHKRLLTTFTMAIFFACFFFWLRFVLILFFLTSKLLLFFVLLRFTDAILFFVCLFFAKFAFSANNDFVSFRSVPFLFFFFLCLTGQYGFIVFLFNCNPL